MDNAKTNAELHQEKLRLEKSISRIQNAIKGINESIVAALEGINAINEAKAKNEAKANLKSAEEELNTRLDRFNNLHLQLTNKKNIHEQGLEMYESRLAQIEKTLELDEQISNLQD